VLVCASPGLAQERQTLNFTLGYFTPLGAGSRASGDVLTENSRFLLFDTDQFNGASVGGEWLIPFGQFFEGGAGVSFSQQTVPTVYTDFVDNDGFEIEQDLQLRLVPIAFTIRVVPTGQRSIVQPYFGAGLGIINYRYTEVGDFIDFGAGRVVFPGTFRASGTETGPVALGGVRFAGQTASGGFEIRYQKAEADLSNEFAAPKLDLGGWTYNFTFGVRF
jgi:hypothetical protein